METENSVDKYFGILIPESGYYSRNLVMILEPSGANCFFESWIARDKAYRNEGSGMCVLLDKLVFNIHRYFGIQSVIFSFNLVVVREVGGEEKKKKLKILVIHKIIDHYFVC